MKWNSLLTLLLIHKNYFFQSLIKWIDRVFVIKYQDKGKLRSKGSNLVHSSSIHFIWWKCQDNRSLKKLVMCSQSGNEPGFSLSPCKEHRFYPGGGNTRHECTFPHLLIQSRWCIPASLQTHLLGDCKCCQTGNQH